MPDIKAKTVGQLSMEGETPAPSTEPQAKRDAIGQAVLLLRAAGLSAQIADYRWLNNGAPMAAIVLPGFELSRREQE